MISWFLFLAACSNSQDGIAVEVCEAVPALTLDAAGRALVMDHVAEEEQRIWKDAEPSPGMRALGTPAFGAIRANSSCELIRNTPSGSNGTHFVLSRTEPILTGTRVFDRYDLIDQDSVKREVNLWWRDGAFWVDLQKAQKEAATARQLAREGQEEAAEKAFAELYSWFPDPTLFAERGLLVLAPTDD